MGACLDGRGGGGAEGEGNTRFVDLKDKQGERVRPKLRGEGEESAE